MVRILQVMVGFDPYLGCPMANTRTPEVRTLPLTCTARIAEGGGPWH